MEEARSGSWQFKFGQPLRCGGRNGFLIAMCRVGISAVRKTVLRSRLDFLEFPQSKATLDDSVLKQERNLSSTLQSVLMPVFLKLLKGFSTDSTVEQDKLKYKSNTWEENLEIHMHWFCSFREINCVTLDPRLKMEVTRSSETFPTRIHGVITRDNVPNFHGREYIEHDEGNDFVT